MGRARRGGNVHPHTTIVALRSVLDDVAAFMSAAIGPDPGDAANGL
jgi:hypothetical protein